MQQLRVGYQEECLGTLPRRLSPELPGSGILSTFSAHLWVSYSSSSQLTYDFFPFFTYSPTRKWQRKIFGAIHKRRPQNSSILPPPHAPCHPMSTFSQPLPLRTSTSWSHFSTVSLSSDARRPIYSQYRQDTLKMDLFLFFLTQTVSP